MRQLLNDQVTIVEFMFLKLLFEKSPQTVSELAQECGTSLSHMTAVGVCVAMEQKTGISLSGYDM